MKLFKVYCNGHLFGAFRSEGEAARFIERSRAEDKEAALRGVCFRNGLPVYDVRSE